MTGDHAFPLYQVDAFTDKVLGGNPAAVMPLQQWPSDTVLQAIAAENNLSETAYFAPEGNGFRLRWFTPAVEVELCGHATLATAHVLYRHLNYTGDAVSFFTRSGELMVALAQQPGQNGPARYTMDFPLPALGELTVPDGLETALGVAISDMQAPVGNPSMAVCVVEDEAAVRALSPDFAGIAAATPLNIIATAQGDSCDIVSRFFGPQVGIDEDPVTGSAHCCLAAYWGKRLGATSLSARQLSARGGGMDITIDGDRVKLGGAAVTYLVGEVVAHALL